MGIGFVSPRQLPQVNQAVPENHRHGQGKDPENRHPPVDPTAPAGLFRHTALATHHVPNIDTRFHPLSHFSPCTVFLLAAIPLFCFTASPLPRLQATWNGNSFKLSCGIRSFGQSKSCCSMMSSTLARNLSRGFGSGLSSKGMC